MNNISAAETEFDLDLDLDTAFEDAPAMEAKSFTGTGTCLSCPVTSWHC
ncbi:hypothetical protein ACFWZ2_24915 [Streptomyces sp. NPDC059002]|uniref:Uncharacterized protein n=1 Tax=Streptomyces formicae TaxID=1616117 RepID=A0A291Q449_9ACTN|nr:hypothetical protein [Streptomyces formicae]ATL26244.1 hypothetical protein KY5_1226c [Streptomyces formicae]